MESGYIIYNKDSTIEIIAAGMEIIAAGNEIIAAGMEIIAAGIVSCQNRVIFVC